MSSKKPLLKDDVPCNQVRVTESWPRAEPPTPLNTWHLVSLRGLPPNEQAQPY
ncbi:UNVERIFIED_CONTAM: hypothetical protein FKN15_010349 [Acipenser sinensis]